MKKEYISPEAAAVLTTSEQALLSGTKVEEFYIVTFFIIGI